MVLAVVELQCLLGDVRSQCVLGVGKLGQSERHVFDVSS